MATTGSRRSGERRSSSGSVRTAGSRHTASSATRKKRTASGGERGYSTNTAIRNNSRSRRRKKTQRRRGSSTVILKYLLLLLAIIAVAVLAVRGVSGLLSSGSEAEVTTLTFESSGMLTLEEVEDLVSEGYDAETARDYVTQAIDSFNAGSTGKVKLVKFKETDTGVYLKTAYDNYDTYNSFTGYEVYAGTVGEYTANEGVFNDIFASVTDGVKGDVTPSSDFAANGDLKLVILSENITVRVNGTIRYVSNANTTVTGTDTVQISQADGNEDQAGLTYIIYE